MEYEKIKQLIDDMGNSKLTTLDIDFPDGTKISMKKEEKQVVVVNDDSDKFGKVEGLNRVNGFYDGGVMEGSAQGAEVLDTDVKVEIDAGNVVTSPMVGTFYSKSSPNSEPYVTVGQIVKKGDVLCIVEAMKLMNEIESEFDGVVKEILVKDGDPVEYGKPLFIIE